jgi:hypothetical protein
MGFYTTEERIFDLVSYDTIKYPYPYGDPLVFHFSSNSFTSEPLEHRVICVGSYETQPYDKSLPSFLYPFTGFNLKAVIESLLIVYKDLYGKTFIQIYDKMLKTKFNENPPKYPTTLTVIYPQEVIEFEKEFLQLFYSMISYVLVRYSIKIDTEHFIPFEYYNRYGFIEKLNKTTKDCKYLCSFKQDDFIKTYSKDKHDLFEQIYCFLRDIHRHTIMIKRYMHSFDCPPYRPESEVYFYGNNIVYYHNTLAKLKMLKIPSYDTKKILHSLFNSSKDNDL